MKLSICIPTYNRPQHLPNCLNSIYLAKKNCNLDFEVCVSDNGSDYDVKKIIDDYKIKFDITLNVNKENLGYHPNLLKTISISKGEFVWAIGDDDLLLPNSLKKIEELFKKYNDIDFFCVNSCNLDYKYLSNFKKPFDTKNLPQNMETFSKKRENLKCNFWDLIDYKIVFDFLNVCTAACHGATFTLSSVCSPSVVENSLNIMGSKSSLEKRCPKKSLLQIPRSVL